MERSIWDRPLNRWERAAGGAVGGLVGALLTALFSNCPPGLFLFDVTLGAVMLAFWPKL